MRVLLVEYVSKMRHKRELFKHTCMLSIINYNVFPHPAHIPFFCFLFLKATVRKLRLNSQRQVSAFVKHSPDILSEAFKSTGRITSSKEKKMLITSFWFPYTQVICVYFIMMFFFLLACFILSIAAKLSIAWFAFRCEKGMAVARGPEPGGPSQTADCFGPQ